MEKITAASIFITRRRSKKTQSDDITLGGDRYGDSLRQGLSTSNVYFHGAGR
jgi:hypothetical protein